MNRCETFDADQRLLDPFAPETVRKGYMSQRRRDARQVAGAALTLSRAAYVDWFRRSHGGATRLRDEWMDVVVPSLFGW